LGQIFVQEKVPRRAVPVRRKSGIQVWNNCSLTIKNINFGDSHGFLSNDVLECVIQRDLKISLGFKSKKRKKFG